MTLVEFFGCALITFGPPLSMFWLSVAHDPVKIIVLITSAFFWLMSFLVGAISWSVISLFCDYLIVGAYLAVLYQEFFRYLFQFAVKRAQTILNNIISNATAEASIHPETSNDIQIIPNCLDFGSKVGFSYVSGIGFGFMNAACLTSNVLSDSIGPGTVGLKGDSQYFVLVTSLTALAFIILNLSWSVLISESVEKSDHKLLLIVVITHLIATTVTFANRVHLQLLSLLVVYSLAGVCGFGALQVSGLRPKLLWTAYRNRRN